jgi:hypothetical protein
MNQSGTSRNATWKFVLAVFASAVSVAFAFLAGEFLGSTRPKTLVNQNPGGCPCSVGGWSATLVHAGIPSLR